MIDLEVMYLAHTVITHPTSSK